MSAVKEKAIKKAPQATALAARFAKINQHRLTRMLESLSARQRDFVEIIPLLFHVNHPLLPGYISKDIPAGIADYAPTKSAIKAAKKLARSFDYDHRLLRFFPIKGIFSRGSPGTIAYSKTSDLDMWLCFDPAVEEHEVALLEQKAQKIEAYAKTLNLEVHFFILSAESFRSGETLSLSDESSGSSQHALLLDEFYRSALLIAGLQPLWWCVPNAEEYRYTEYVAELIAENSAFDREYIDFGGLTGIPASEFFGAGVWQLYKSIDSPFKSVLKLLLIESYVAEFPDIDLLSYRYKNLVAQETTGVNDIDPYVLMYRKVDEYLRNTDDPERQFLLQKCFYLKINLPLSKKLNSDDDWQVDLLTDFIGYWEWSARQLNYLDSRPTWKIGDAAEERKKVVSALNKSYALLSNFARHSDEEKKISNHDLHTLGKKLYAAFERKPAKVDIITRGICKQPIEENLSISWRATEDVRGVWDLYAERLGTDGGAKTKPIKSSDSLSRILTWCHFNHLIDNNTNWQVFAPEKKLQAGEVTRVLNKIEEFFPGGTIPQASSEDLSNNLIIRKMILIVNFGQVPLQGRFNQQVLTTNHNDAFKFGGQKINLIQSAAVIYVTSWEEVYVRNFSGPASIQESLLTVANQLHMGGSDFQPEFDVFAACRNYSLAINNTAEKYYQDLSQFLRTNSDVTETRYVSQIEKSFCSVVIKHGKSKLTQHGSYRSLLKTLEQPNEEFIVTGFSDQAESCKLLKLMYETARRGSISFFIQQHDDKADIYVIDEKGSLFVQRRPSLRAELTANQFGQFFRNITEHQPLEHNPTAVPNGLAHLQMYQVQNQREGFKLTFLDSSEEHFETQIPVKVFVDANSGNAQIVTIMVADTEFSAPELGSSLFNEIAQAIVNKRETQANYPLFINNLEFSRHYQATRNISSLQTTHLLNFKKRIEYKMSKALTKII